MNKQRDMTLKMQRDLIVKAVLADKDGKKYRQPGAREISIKIAAHRGANSESGVGRDFI